RRAIVALPPNVRVRDRGPLAAADVASELARSDVLLFPTFGENFGHVVLEALLAGVPVLASDRTPWRGLAAREAGWDVPLEDVAAFRERLAALVAMDDLEWQRWSRGARRRARSGARRRRRPDRGERLASARRRRRPLLRARAKPSDALELRPRDRTARDARDGRVAPRRAFPEPHVRRGRRRYRRRRRGRGGSLTRGAGRVRRAPPSRVRGAGRRRARAGRAGAGGARAPL